MVRDPFRDDDAPGLQDVLDALDDPDCRAIITELEAPMTASELSDAADVPLSTTYRKLDLLTEASLLSEMTEIRSDGQHTTRYEIDFEEVRIALDEEQSFEVGIARPERSPDEQLAAMWSEVRKET
ncbi:helix-turn-helix transcriptional regulator [Halostella sp. JP-L12]|uniref:winged helix-turn-helix domain-containing protein n=1 Tax=Halostella TaxID=1843185 RepID=UPI000EF7C5E9|nr:MULTISPECIES: helix-turn-helix domain-containing protein [Halostella]NHN49848.1 helix-turn-helix transcriptional regulator [Halostella sp. JP-L12]